MTEKDLERIIELSYDVKYYGNPRFERWMAKELLELRKFVREVSEEGDHNRFLLDAQKLKMKWNIN